MNINIKINGQALPVNVTIEVHDCIRKFDRKEENLSHQKRRHWDTREFDENIISAECSSVKVETPEEIICQKESVLLHQPNDRHTYRLYSHIAVSKNLAIFMILLHFFSLHYTNIPRKLLSNL